ncbi:hypothetical protein ISN45_Aa06g003180 [Arabidopsis thaliana x Arabidopsis arenosa]|uniref:Uncharacterized protein n=1 Tax=Arabidopsis thaliana x Arabidopsis arenosa TaxID=1240361 RepID=A0A8T1YTB2_9BRAS|nr:hypothetical protein ISN45_Aa06g003180 [Arabidopsis thaliana x Arabidopsis arenosa]
MDKVTSIFVVLLLISSCLILRSEGQFRCKSAADCNTRDCRVGTHVICNTQHKCKCAHGSPIGGQCYTVEDCYRSGCPPNSHVICDTIRGNFCTLTNIFIVLLLIYSCLILGSEGKCKSVAECDPRRCRIAQHIICNTQHECTCAHGSPIGGQCDRLEDCDLSGCPPNSHVICNLTGAGSVCTCIPN